MSGARRWRVDFGHQMPLARIRLWTRTDIGLDVIKDPRNVRRGQGAQARRAQLQGSHGTGNSAE